MCLRIISVDWLGIGGKRYGGSEAISYVWAKFMGLAVVLGLLRGLSGLSFRVRCRCGYWLGCVARIVVPRRTAIMRTNIRLCFPELSKQAREVLISKHYTSLGIGIIDTGLAWRGESRALSAALEVEGREHLLAAQATGKGILLISAHFTQLDLMGLFLHRECSYHVVVRPQKSGYLNQYAVKKRASYSASVLYQHELIKCCRLLKEGEVILYFPDQDYGAKHSVFAPFFDVLAASVMATEKIAKITGAVVLPVFLYRDESIGKYRLVFKPLLTPFPRQDGVSSATAVNQVVEQAVRRFPEQYLWGHRRFKSRPKGEASVYA